MNSKTTGGDLRSVLHDVPVGIVIFRGPEFIVEIANKIYLEIIDRKEKDFVGKPLFKGLPEVRDRVEPLLKSVYTTGVPYHGHEFPVTLNRYGKSELCYFNFVYSPVYDADGKVNGIVVVANEVTSGVTARQRLEESETKFRNLVMQSPIAMTIFLGEEMVIDTANRRMIENIWRRKSEEVVGKKILDVFPELRRQKFPDLLHKVYHEGVSHSESEAAAFVEGDDGMRKFYLDYSYEPLFDSNQNVFGILVTVTDVTERVEARKKLEEAEERSRLAIDSARLGSYEIDVPTGKFKFSKRLFEIYGVSENASYEDFIDLFHPEDRAIRDRAHMIARETGRLHYEVRVIRPDSNIVWIRCDGKMFYDDDARPKTLVGIVQDITEQKDFAEELERQVQQRTEQLQAANEEIAAASEEIAATNEELSDSNSRLVTANFELEQFNYAASHDLQEPVRKIQTFASFLLTEGENASKEKITDFLKRIYTSAERMKSLIDDLLLYARDSRTEKQFVATDLNDVLEAVKTDLDLVIEQKHAMLEIAHLPTLRAVPGQMHQLFRNLLSNSLKFTRDGVRPEIRVTSTVVKDYVHITFEDNGIGFQQEFADYIFKLFKRLHSRSEYDGTGIGLSLCKKIVQNHGGEIRAESTPGAGTVMYIRLPLHAYED
jgi:PAS domain S-box-containing protein